MSAPDLDPDLNCWPNDPYQLLGVRPNISLRELRRAYTRLIRTYKPEQYPEHFRRIREAYETVLRHVEWFSQSGSDEAVVPEATEPALADRASPGAQPDGTGDVPPEPTRSEAQGLRRFEEELRDIWESACSGRETAAYERLRELHDQRPSQADVSLQLYWMLSLYPELDPQREACDWLVQALRANGFTGPLRELYRRELADHPEEALGPRCTQLLECPARAGLLADLAEWRWQAAERLQRWAVIEEDLQLLSQRLARDEEEIWARLLLAAVDHLAWAGEHEPHDLFLECVQELEQAEHLHPRLGYQLDRLDFLSELSDGWLAMGSGQGVCDMLRELIPLSWARPLPEFEPQLVSLLEVIAREPEQSLQDLDEIHEAASAVLAHLGEILGQLCHRVELPASEPASSASLARAIFDFLDETAWRTYKQLRLRLMDFCLHEAIAPEQVAQVVKQRPEYQLTEDEHLADRLTADWPLRHVCEAVRLFWA